MKNVLYLIILTAFVSSTAFAEDAYNCRPGSSSSTINTNFRAHVSEVPLKLSVERGNVDLGNIVPGSTRDYVLGDWDNTVVVEIECAKGYKLKLDADLEKESGNYGGQRTGLTIDYKYRLGEGSSWILPPSENWSVDVASNKTLTGNLFFYVSVFKLTADPGSYVGERIFRLQLTAEYKE